MLRSVCVGLAFALLAALAACGPRYSPNTYSSVAVQQANPVERGVIIGARKVDVSAPGVVGAATGGAAGGIAGAQTPGGAGSAFGALGGALIGGLVGSGVEHAVADTSAYEYIVREAKGVLVSVTQKDTAPLKIGTNVLVIAGKQARIVPDYTEAAAPAPPPAPATQPAPPPPAVTATPLAPLPPLPAFNPAVPPAGQ